MLIPNAYSMTLNNMPEAIAKSQEAILAQPDVKFYKAKIEAEIWKMMNQADINKNHTTAALVAYSLVRGEVTTKHFKNLYIKSHEGVKLRPQIDYNYRTGEGTGALVLEWTF